MLLSFVFAAACSSTPAPTPGVAPQPTAPSTLEERVEVKPFPTKIPPAPVMPKTAEPSSTTAPAAPKAALPAPATEAPGGPVKPVTQIWHLRKGKLDGPMSFGHATQLSKTKNKKTPGFTIETCYRYATFAIVEMRSSDEVGAAEVTVRHEPPRGFALCAVEFKGKTTNLKIIEGYFAGVADGLIMIDGADSTEGQTEFQLLQADSGLEVMKSFHHPTEDFSIIKVGDATSLEYFAKLAVKCGLASEGEACWKKVLSENKVIGKTPMPDCAGIFDKSKTALSEPALVFTRARVNKLGSPPKFLGGKATCQPAP